MKKLLTLLLCMSFLSLSMCKNKKKADSEEEMITIEMTRDDESKAAINADQKSGDCDDFMDDYEEWMDRYIELLRKYKENPVGLASSQEYSSMSMEMMEWSSKWSSLAIDCARNSEYEARFNKIQEKVEKEMEALGFN